jgi:hypothetical protein
MKANMVASELRLGFTKGCHDRRNRDVKSYREGLAAMQESGFCAALAGGLRAAA